MAPGGWLLLCLGAALGHRIVVDRVGEPRSSVEPSARRLEPLGEPVEPEGEGRAAPPHGGPRGLAPGPGRVRIVNSFAAAVSEVGETTTTTISEVAEAAAPPSGALEVLQASPGEASRTAEVEQKSSTGRAAPSPPEAPAASDAATTPDEPAGSRRISPVAPLPRESSANGTQDEVSGQDISTVPLASGATAALLDESAGAQGVSLAELSALGEQSANATREGSATESASSQPLDDTGFAVQNLKAKLDGERQQLMNMYFLGMLFVLGMALLVYIFMSCGWCERKAQRAKAGKSILKKSKGELQTRHQQLDSLLKEIAGGAEQARLSAIPDDEEQEDEKWSWTMGSGRRGTAASSASGSRGTAPPGARRGTAAKLTFAEAHLPRGSRTGSRDDARGGSSSPSGSPRPPILQIGAGSEATGSSHTDYASLVSDVSRVAKRLQGFVEKYPKTGGSLLNRSARKRYVVVLPKPAPALYAGDAPDASKDVDLWRSGYLGYWETEASFAKRERPKGSIALRDIYEVRLSKEPECKRSAIIEHRQEGQTYEMELLLGTEKAAQTWVANFREVLRRLHSDR